jgi:chorismate mutase
MTRRILILEGKEQRNDAIQTIKSEGGKILHDSGRRAIIIETGEDAEREKKIRSKLHQRARLLHLKNSKKQSFQHTIEYCRIPIQVFNQYSGSVELDSRM